MPIQGSEADLMKFAMVKIKELIDSKYRDDAFMLLQIHDELILEVKDKRIKEFTDESKNIMENIVEFLVPLEVHANIGHYWELK